ncbi:hypothetical protein FHS79_001812 [Polymorphobacter multimanifer]|uniref:Putative auto-transporter adhesin head GIN domain-containing protein n=1 Tax=Polymorphobacter multimanifer TaxID=1070431 RepID=A0A841L9K3_9SPHN|nr:head GIN domain-containing protein [Polymorphobacter multimanifer]MBB6227643.1 hypothetical protein [Polymorphobacter multimanifer]
MRILPGLAAVGTASVLAASLLVARFAPAAAAERGYSVPAFDRIVLAGAADVDFRAGPRVTVTASGNDLALGRLDISVKDGALVIGQKRGGAMLGKVKVRVTGPAPRAGTISGSGRLAFDRVSAERFDALVSGSGDLDVAAMQARNADWRLSGSGSMHGAGSVGALKTEMSGAGTMALGGLAARTLTARLSGSGEIDARASETATIELAGSGNIRVRGGAKCRSRKSGSGNIVCVP